MFLFGYKSLENPIGIETMSSPNFVMIAPSYKSLENPIGIETSPHSDARGIGKIVTSH